MFSNRMATNTNQNSVPNQQHQDPIPMSKEPQRVFTVGPNLLMGVERKIFVHFIFFAIELFNSNFSLFFLFVSTRILKFQKKILSNWLRDIQ
jgi:hypothetical protein